MAFQSNIVVGKDIADKILNPLLRTVKIFNEHKKFLKSCIILDILIYKRVRLAAKWSKYLNVICAVDVIRSLFFSPFRSMWFNVSFYIYFHFVGRPCQIHVVFFMVLHLSFAIVHLTITKGISHILIFSLQYEKLCLCNFEQNLLYSFHCDVAL